MPKNIIIFSDGTGQEGGERYNTNIYKIFNLIEDRTERQIAFYDPGLGTGLIKYTAYATGFGLSRNIKQCYRFIFENYNAGDNIYLFGFSRGAATVRSLSSFIHYFGILPKSRPELIKQAYKIYKTSNKDKRDRKAANFINKHHTMWTDIKFIGCFDTVAALGIPLKVSSTILNSIPGLRYNFHDFDLSVSIRNAYHAIAIDDERKTFHPILWNAEIDSSKQNMKQVWFSGMHTDVGGGYKEQELAGIPLVWLVQMAVENGLHIYSKYKVEILEDANGKMHDSRELILGILYWPKVRFWDEDRSDKPIVHKSVLVRKEATNDEYNPWILKTNYKIEPWVPYDKQSWKSTSI